MLVTEQRQATPVIRALMLGVGQLMRSSATLALFYRRMRFHIQDLQLSSKLHDLTIRLNIQVPLTLGTLNAADP